MSEDSSALPRRRSARSVLGGALVAAGVAAAGLVAAAPSLAVAAGLPAAVTNRAGLVDPFVGTGRGGATVGRVDTFPAADMPFGMIQWGPDTESRPAGGGYSYTDSTITGFSLTHVSGPGCAIAGDFPILPLTGSVPSNPEGASVPLDHSSEVAHPGYYAVNAGGVATKIAVTDRAGVASFTYPATNQAQLLIKVADSAAGGSSATFQTQGDTEVSGSVMSGHFCGQPNSYTVYFAARFDQPFTASGTWSAQPGSAVISGGWLTFDTTHDPVVGMQVALSYVSTANAMSNLGAEAHTWNVNQVAAAATRAWNRQLGAISIAGGTRTTQAEFYTALYHASLSPSLFSDDNGQYIGFDDKVHTVPGSHPQYANFSDWDIYRSEVPLLATIDPSRAEDMATSLLNDAAQGGSLPKWPAYNAYTGVMNGDSSDPILANTYAFGARDFNAGTALKDMVNGANGTTAVGQGWFVERPNAAAYIANGYVPNTGTDSSSPLPNGASETLEYALDDFAISRLAADLRQSSAAATFAARSQNWANVFDTADRYVEPRDATGAFPSGAPVQIAGFGQGGFQEGNAAQYTWMVPQNLAGLIQGLGGQDAANSRLDSFFSRLNAGPNKPFAWSGNEPELDTPWVYDSTGEPWKTQQVVHEVDTQLYSLTPGGEPGNDDLGAMSSWYVWSMLGLYPQTPGVPMLVLGTPQFRRAVIHGAYGNLTVATRGTGDYVQGLTVDRRPSERPWIDVNRSHNLVFSLSSSPTPWGAAAGDAPPSFGSGPVKFHRARMRPSPSNRARPRRRGRLT